MLDIYNKSSRGPPIANDSKVTRPTTPKAVVPTGGICKLLADLAVVVGLTEAVAVAAALTK